MAVPGQATELPRQQRGNGFPDSAAWCSIGNGHGSLDSDQVEGEVGLAPGATVNWLRRLGLWPFELCDADPECFQAFIDGLRLFGLGASWGGFESLVMSVIFNERPAPWGIVGLVIRLHIRLEDASTLIEDLAAAWRASA